MLGDCALTGSPRESVLRDCTGYAPLGGCKKSGSTWCSAGLIRSTRLPLPHVFTAQETTQDYTIRLPALVLPSLSVREIVCDVMNMLVHCLVPKMCSIVRIVAQCDVR